MAGSSPGHDVWRNAFGWKPQSAVSAARFIFGGEAAEGGFVTAVAEPFAMMMHAEAVVELAGRVPVEHMKIDAAPAALDGDRGKPRHKALPDAPAARTLCNIEVFEIEARPAEPGRKARVEQRAPRRL